MAHRSLCLLLVVIAGCSSTKHTTGSPPEPTPTSSSSPTLDPSSVATPTPTVSSAPTPTPTPTHSSIPTPTPTPSADGNTLNPNTPTAGNGNQAGNPNNNLDANAWTLPYPTSGNANDLIAFAGQPYTFIGRVYPGNASPLAEQTLSWTETGVMVRVTNTTTVTLNQTAPATGTRSYLYALVDGRAGQLVETPQTTYTLGGLDPCRIHTVRIIKRTEAALGNMLFDGLTLDPNGRFVSPPPLPTRRVEILGDAIANGYGTTNPQAGCTLSAETEDATLAFGALAGRAFGAEVHLVAWTGIGLYRNAPGQASGLTMPTLWRETVANVASPTYDLQAWIPQAVVIQLGASDFASGDPGQTNFVGAYQTLISQIRSAYGSNTVIFCAVPPTLTSGNLTTLQGYIQNMVSTYNNGGDTRVFVLDFSTASLVDNSSCQANPTAAAHRAMAAMLVAALQQQLGWSDPGGFTLTGQASGLAGTVVLTADGNTTFAVNANGPFVVPQTYAAGQGYDITIATQPEGQTCVVLNGAGAVTNANVSNVYVLCDDTVTLSGMVEMGVNVSGPVYLTNSTTGDVAVSPNGAFSFFVPQNPGDPYNVTLGNLPAHQSCNLTPANGQGNVNPGQTDIFTVDCQPLTYAVSVSVTGLIEGANVSLLNQTNLASGGTRNDSLVVGNGNGTFALSLAYGDIYTVSVSQAPAGTDCVVSGGNGTMNDTTVAVAVTCYTKDAITGVATGMAANSNFVINNGNDVLIVTAANPNFTFPSSVPVGTTISPVIQLQPASQTCSIAVPGGGVAAGGNVILSVACQPIAANYYGIAGNLSGLLPGSTATLQNGHDIITAHNGLFSFQTPVANAGNYNVWVATQPVGQNCVVSQGLGTVNGNTVTNVAIACQIYLRFDANEAADVVVGQTDFLGQVQNQGNSTPTATGFYSASGRVYTSSTGATYFADSQGRRVVGFNALPTQNGQAGDFVLGQRSLTSSTSAVNGQYYRSPWSINGDGYNILIADYSASRVLVYFDEPTSLESAAVVIGQTALTYYGSGCSPNNLYQPEEAIFAGGGVVIADTYNHRVLIYDTVPSVNGADATYVLGQSDFGSCAANANTNAASASTLWYPNGVWSDGTRLGVADTYNNRVLLWNHLAGISTNGQPADVVIGHNTMTASTAGTGATAMALPNAIASDGTHLFVAGGSSNRVAVYNTIPTVNGAAADLFLGQADANGTACNQGASNPNAYTLCTPQGVSVSGTSLIVADMRNYRYLIYYSN